MILAIPRPSQTLRRANPSTATKVLIGTAIALGIGTTIFFKTRRAAAASQGAKAFEVSDDCMTIKVVDESAAKAAALAASLVVRPKPSDPALGAVRNLMVVVFPECGWTTIPNDLTFIHGFNSYTWLELSNRIGDRTVGELTQLVGADPTITSSELPRLVQWLLSAPPAVSHRRLR